MAKTIECQHMNKSTERMTIYKLNNKLTLVICPQCDKQLREEVLEQIKIEKYMDKHRIKKKK